MPLGLASTSSGAVSRGLSSALMSNHRPRGVDRTVGLMVSNYHEGLEFARLSPILHLHAGLAYLVGLWHLGMKYGYHIFEFPSWCSSISLCPGGPRVRFGDYDWLSHAYRALSGSRSTSRNEVQ